MHANKASVQTYKASVHSQNLHWLCTDVSKSLNAALLKQNKYNKNVQGPIVTCMHASRASLHAQKASLHCQYLHCTLTDFSQLLSTFLNAPPLSSTFLKIPQHFPTSSTFLNFPYLSSIFLQFPKLFSTQLCTNFCLLLQFYTFDQHELGCMHVTSGP